MIKLAITNTKIRDLTKLFLSVALVIALSALTGYGWQEMTIRREKAALVQFKKMDRCPVTGKTNGDCPSYKIVKDGAGYRWLKKDNSECGE